MNATPQVTDQHIVLLYGVAHRMARRIPVEESVMISDGYIGLVEALKSFDPSRGVKLSTHATRRISGAIIDAIRKRDAISRDTRRKHKIITAANHAFRSDNLRDATDEELAEITGLRLSEVSRCRSLPWTCHLMGPRSRLTGEDKRDISCDDIVGGGPSYEDAIQSDEIRRIVRPLNRIQRAVVILYHVVGMTMKETAAAIGITESRVSQIHTLAMEILRGTVVRQ